MYQEAASNIMFVYAESISDRSIAYFLVLIFRTLEISLKNPKWGLD